MFRRCPKSWARDEAQEEMRLVEDVLWFRKYNVLPTTGGKHDQHPWFLEAADLFAAEESGKG